MTDLLKSTTHTIRVWYIYLHEWLIFLVDLGKYTSPMEAMGYGFFVRITYTYIINGCFWFP